MSTTRSSKSSKSRRSACSVESAPRVVSALGCAQLPLAPRRTGEIAGDRVTGMLRRMGAIDLARQHPRRPERWRRASLRVTAQPPGHPARGDAGEQTPPPARVEAVEPAGVQHPPGGRRVAWGRSTEATAPPTRTTAGRVAPRQPLPARAEAAPREAAPHDHGETAAGRVATEGGPKARTPPATWTRERRPPGAPVGRGGRSPTTKQGKDPPWK
jgi:hypothetical protein